MPSSNSNGSQTATLDTEHTLATITTAGTYQLQINTSAMALGDVLLIREKIKVGPSGTTATMRCTRLEYSPDQPVVVTIPVIVLNEVVFTIEQTDGTGRAYPWEIARADA